MIVPSSWARLGFVKWPNAASEFFPTQGESSAFRFCKERGNVVTTLPAENEGSFSLRSRGRKKRAFSDQAWNLAFLESPLPSASAGIEGSARRWGSVLPQTSAPLPPDPSSSSTLRALTGTWWPAAVPAPGCGEPLSWQR